MRTGLKYVLEIFSFMLVLGIIGFVQADNVTCYSDSDCISGYFGNEFCQNNNVYKNFLNSSCINPGTNTSYCSNNSVPTLLIDCGINDYSNWSNNYCMNNNVYHSRNGTQRGCRIINPQANISGCFSEFVFEEALIENCHHGCENGICIHMFNMTCMNNSECNDDDNFTEDLCINPGTMNSSCVHNPIRCFNDLQCGNNGFTINKFCKNHDVYSDYNQYKCLNPETVNSSCSINTTSKLYEKCSYKCLNGECYERNPIDYPDYIYDDSEPVSQTGITGYDIYIKNSTYDVVKISPTITPPQNNSLITQLLSKNLFVILMIVIIALIVLIIILTLMR